MGKIKFKNRYLKFKLIPSRIENNVIFGETKFTIYGNLDNEKITILRRDFSYEMKMFRNFLKNLEKLRNLEEAKAIFHEKDNSLTITIENSEEKGILNWVVEAKNIISEASYTKLDIAFSTNQYSLDSIIKDIGYFVVNPVDF